MKVYPKQIVFCPKVNEEQNGNICSICKYFNNYRLETARPPSVDCKFDK